MEVDTEFVERVEARLGMGHGAWDHLKPEDICEAVLVEARVAELEAERDTERAGWRKACDEDAANNALAQAELDRYRAALIWALGAGEDFPPRPEGKGAYWWRSELQKRAGLKWDGEKFIPE